jgi:uncharacterized protein
LSNRPANCGCTRDDRSRCAAAFATARVACNEPSNALNVVPVRTRPWTATSISVAARLAAAGFVALAAVGGFIRALGGSRGVAAAFAAVGVLGALVALVLVLLHRRAQVCEERQALWWKPPQRVRELAAGDGIYALGVETEAPEALETAGLGGRSHAPYAPRDIDTRLVERLTAAASLDHVSLIIVLGPSKAGKSRTVLEAVRAVLGGAWLIAPRDAASLARLSNDRPPREVEDGPCILWLDDIERFAVGLGESGLNTAALEGFRRWQRPVLVVGTAGGKGVQLADSEHFGEPTRDLLRAHPPLDLHTRLTPSEQQVLRRLESYLPEAVDRIAAEGIGEFMIAAPRLREKLAETQRYPEGVAVTQAAIDWRRVGMYRPIPESALRALFVRYLPGKASEGRFERGLEWATTPIYSRVALLEGRTEYEPYDYVVHYERQRGRPIPAGTWQEIIDNWASTDELVSVGVAAVGESGPKYAEDAFRRADERGDGNAANNLGVILRQQGDLEGAEAAWKRGDERGNGRAANNLGVLLSERGDLDGAEAALKRADERGSARASHNLGFLLFKRGDHEDAEAAWKRADQRGDGGAAFNLGLRFSEGGDPEGAEAAWKRADDRGHASASNYLGMALAKRGEVQAAEAAWKRGDERGDGGAAFNLGLLLLQRGDPQGAFAALVRAKRRAKRERNETLVKAATSALLRAEVAIAQLRSK